MNVFESLREAELLLPGVVLVAPAEWMVLDTLEQYCKPRSKKKRIRRKWAKRMRNWQAAPNPEMTLFTNELLMLGHPRTVTTFKRRHERLGFAGLVKFIKAEEVPPPKVKPFEFRLESNEPSMFAGRTYGRRWGT